MTRRVRTPPLPPRPFQPLRVTVLPTTFLATCPRAGNTQSIRSGSSGGGGADADASAAVGASNASASASARGPVTTTTILRPRAKHRAKQSARARVTPRGASCVRRVSSVMGVCFAPRGDTTAAAPRSSRRAADSRALAPRTHTFHSTRVASHDNARTTRRDATRSERIGDDM